VLLSGQPDANWFQRHTTSWSNDIAIEGVVDDLRTYLGVLAFGLGLVFGFTFDTSLPEFRRRVPERVEEPVAVPAAEPAPELERPAAGETTVREREEQQGR
jgi:hypothetical protein